MSKFAQNLFRIISVIIAFCVSLFGQGFLLELGIVQSADRKTNILIVAIVAVALAFLLIVSEETWFNLSTGFLSKVTTGILIIGLLAGSIWDVTTSIIGLANLIMPTNFSWVLAITIAILILGMYTILSFFISFLKGTIYDFIYYDMDLPEHIARIGNWLYFIIFIGVFVADFITSRRGLIFWLNKQNVSKFTLEQDYILIVATVIICICPIGLSWLFFWSEKNKG